MTPDKKQQSPPVRSRTGGLVSTISHLFAEQLGMASRAGRRQHHLILPDFINEQPIRRNMAFSEPKIISRQRMVAVRKREFFFRLKQLQNRVQPRDIPSLTSLRNCVVKTSFSIRRHPRRQWPPSCPERNHTASPGSSHPGSRALPPSPLPSPRYSGAA